MDWKKIKSNLTGELTLDFSDMADDLLAVYNTFKSVDKLKTSNSGQWLACKQMYDNWLDKYQAKTNADLDVKAAYCSMFAKMVAELKHSGIALPLVTIKYINK